jgi:hypothetical protein
MKTYKIINDSGVDYQFIAAFGHPTTPWIGQIVKGGEVNSYGCITVEKPFGITGTYTLDASNFEEIKN